MAVILIADDDPALRKVVERMLVRAGHAVFLASNGVEAVAVFRSYPKEIDVVVMDMIMPVMDGAQAIERIRETRPDVPVICISGYASEGIPADVTFLRKPFSTRALVSLVDQVLRG